MTRAKLQEMTVEQLADRFVAMALDQDQALLMDEIAKFNRLYDRMEAVKNELKSRERDQRQVLISLLQHPNAQVRLKAAIATLALAPKTARATLQLISDRQEYPQAAYARDIIKGLDDGTYMPI